MVSDKIEVIEGKVTRGAIDEVHAVPRWHPAYVGGDSRDGAFVAAIDRRRPGLFMTVLIFVKKHTRPVRRFPRKNSAPALRQTNCRSALHRRLPNGLAAVRVEIDPMSIRRPERV